MSTADKICISLMGCLALLAIAGCLLALLADEEQVTVRPLTPADFYDVADVAPVSGVPVSPDLHHIAEGRVPGPVAARVARTTLPRHASPERAKRTHRTPNHAEPRILTWTGSTL